MKRDDEARYVAGVLLRMNGDVSEGSLRHDKRICVKIDDRAHVQYNADGSRAFVEAVIEIEMPDVRGGIIADESFP